jgi:hypothetical protein
LGRFASPWSKAVRWAAIFVDALIVLESLVVALLFRFGGGVLSEYWWESFWTFATLPATVYVALFLGSGMYRSAPRRTGVYQRECRRRAL